MAMESMEIFLPKAKIPVHLVFEILVMHVQKQFAKVLESVAFSIEKDQSASRKHIDSSDAD